MGIPTPGASRTGASRPETSRPRAGSPGWVLGDRGRRVLLRAPQPAWPSRHLTSRPRASRHLGARHVGRSPGHVGGAPGHVEALSVTWGHFRSRGGTFGHVEVLSVTWCRSGATPRDTTSPDVSESASTSRSAARKRRPADRRAHTLAADGTPPARDPSSAGRPPTRDAQHRTPGTGGDQGRAARPPSQCAGRVRCAGRRVAASPSVALTCDWVR